MMKDRAGKLVKQLSGDMSYYSFTPSKLPPNPKLILITKWRIY